MDFVQPEVAVTQVLCSNTSCAAVGLGADGPRFVELDEKATKSPCDEMDGCALGPSPCVFPSGEETKKVVGVQAELGAAVIVPEIEKLVVNGEAVNLTPVRSVPLMIND